MKYFSRTLQTAAGRLTAGFLALTTLAWLNGAELTGVIDWEPTAAFAAAALAWFFSCFSDSTPAAVATQPKVSAHDQKLFERFLTVIDEPERAFLKDQDFGAAFQTECIKGLREIGATWQGAGFEFDDKELQAAFAPLLQQVRSLSSALALKTQLLPNGFARIHWDYDNEAPSHALAKKLNDEGTALVNSLDDFIRLARPRLA